MVLQDPTETITYMSLKQACSYLGISEATGRNWIRRGLLVPVPSENPQIRFSEEQIRRCRRELKKKDAAGLRSRRNKSYISGRSFYASYVSADCRSLDTVHRILDFLKGEKKINDSLIRTILGYAAYQFALAKEGGLLPPVTNPMEYGLKDACLSSLIAELFPADAAHWIETYPEIFRLPFYYEDKEDVLGLLYISCREMGRRKDSGSYYTPSWVVSRMVARCFDSQPVGDVLDPCCGTGNFLLRLPKNFPAECIYGNDRDRISVLVTRANMALRYPGRTADFWKKHITNRDFLKGFSKRRKYDFIIGNPPWGSRISPESLAELRSSFRTAAKGPVDTADLFVEKSLCILKQGGCLAFVLPEALLQVRSHREVRKLLLERTYMTHLEYAGEIFDGVQCPCILLQLRLTGEEMHTAGLMVIRRNESFQIEQDRELHADRLMLDITDEEYRVFERIRTLCDVEYLRGQADFAMGIVTGDNRRWIRRAEEVIPAAKNLSAATEEAAAVGVKLQSEEAAAEWEYVLLGSDVYPGFLHLPEQAIRFLPDEYQQTAPEWIYRSSPKLVYRFIAEYPVVAWDDQGFLTLNSCNIILPRIPGMDPQYIMAVLNSRVLRYYYQKSFRSVKILRSHLEVLPIPRAEETKMQEVIECTKQIRCCESEEIRRHWEMLLEKHMQELFGLTDEEYEVVCR